MVLTELRTFWMFWVWVSLRTLRFVTDSGKIYIGTASHHGFEIKSFNPGDAAAVRVLGLYVRPKTLLVHEEAVYVMDPTGKVHKFDLPPPLELE